MLLMEDIRVDSCSGVKGIETMMLKWRIVSFISILSFILSSKLKSLLIYDVNSTNQRFLLIKPNWGIRSHISLYNFILLNWGQFLGDLN